MREGHKNSIKLFEEASNNSRSKKLREFAKTHLPLLQKHALEIENIANK